MKKQTIQLSTKKTKTFWFDKDNPAFSLVPGRVTAKEFNKAHAAEGWDGDPVSKESLKFEWYRFTKTKAKQSNVNDLKAVLCTVMEW